MYTKTSHFLSCSECDQPFALGVTASTHSSASWADSTFDSMDTLGPLATSVGTWQGHQGCNVVAVPSRKSQPTDKGRFELLVQQPYREVWTFAAVPEAVRNRGGALDQYVGALTYTQQVYIDKKNATTTTSELIHVENGMLWYLDNVVDYTTQHRVDNTTATTMPSFSIARSANVPHGNTALLLGRHETMIGRPRFPLVSALPRNVGPQAPPEYMNPYLKPVNVQYPTTFLQQAISSSTSGSFSNKVESTLHLTWDSQYPGSSLTSVPFLMERADTLGMQADFWLETLSDGSMQLQYLQVMDLAFHKPIITTTSPPRTPSAAAHDEDTADDDVSSSVIIWPHITLNTLTRVEG